MTRHPSQFPDGDSSDKILNSLDFFEIAGGPVHQVFLLALMLIELDPKSMISSKAFPGSDQPSNEISDSSYSSDSGGGRGCRLISSQPSANQHIQRKKLCSQMLLAIHRAK